MTEGEKQLSNLIQKNLDICCPHSLPSLSKLIKDEAGRDYAADYIFKVCANDGVSVQLAMLNLDSEL